MTEKSTRGFASMSKERHHELSVKGGKAVHAQGKGHQWTERTGTLAALKAIANRRAKRGQ